MSIELSSLAKARILAQMQPDDRLVLDLDNGVGPFSNELLENGLFYRLLLVPASKLPANFKQVNTSEIGPFYAAADTQSYLEPNMAILVAPKWHQLQLSGDTTLLEPNLDVQRVD